MNYWCYVGYAYRSIFFLLHVLNKNNDIINAEYWVLSENRKLISSKENQFFLIAKITSHKTQKIANPQK